jgi:vancomycin permeability regulator SanA
MNLGLLLFIIVNIFRQIDLLISNWNLFSIVDIYINTLKSFSYFAMLILPFIMIFSIYSIVSNFVLIRKEGLNPKRMLGIIIGFLALLGIGGSQLIYFLVKNLLLNTDKQFIKYSLDICLNATLTYIYTLIVATLYCNIRAAKHIPEFNKDFIIILGSKIRKDGTLTPLLKGRVDKAIDFGKLQFEKTKKKIVYVPSGGKGNDETVAEAEAIRKYLLEKGIKENQIIIEDKSTNTFENMKYSKSKIDEINKEAKISFATTNYHVFRSGVIANEQGMDCEGIGSKTKWYFGTNALIREFIAALVKDRKKHLLVLLIIYVFAVILIAIGYHYNMINLYR